MAPFLVHMYVTILAWPLLRSTQSVHACSSNRACMTKFSLASSWSSRLHVHIACMNTCYTRASLVTCELVQIDFFVPLRLKKAVFYVFLKVTLSWVIPSIHTQRTHKVTFWGILCFPTLHTTSHVPRLHRWIKWVRFGIKKNWMYCRTNCGSWAQRQRHTGITQCKSPDCAVQS